MSMCGDSQLVRIVELHQVLCAPFLRLRLSDIPTGPNLWCLYLQRCIHNCVNTNLLEKMQRVCIKEEKAAAKCFSVCPQNHPGKFSSDVDHH